MSKLLEMQKGAEGIVVSVNGDSRFVSRVTSIGLTPGCRVSMLKNEKNRPILIYSRDTMIALNRKDCSNIEMEVNG
ncbi:MAG: ferrous iron transport protein A [Lachnospiraceae bacterium]|nr:ferrous iron transport protein A [Lachnospiraceae bacterium]